MMAIAGGARRGLTAVVTLLFGVLSFAAAAQAPSLRYVDQGVRWTRQLRATFYTQNEGSQLIPRAWLDALRQPGGRPFLDGALARYGYLPNPENPLGLPVGFTQAASSFGPMVGMTCAACHTRQLEMGGTPYRIDGAPAFADFSAFVGDLDAAVLRVLADDAAFGEFAGAVLKAKAADPLARDILHAEVQFWSTRFHALVGGSLPGGRGWGPTRLDAIAVIYNFLAGLDIGPAPTYLMLDNIQKGDAPVRYPFLWNVAHQDFTQWTGVAPNGNPTLGLARSLTEIYGVFASFHPQPTTGSLSPLNRNYLVDNSAFVPGMQTLDGVLANLGAPVWPWPVDAGLAKAGEAVFDRPTEQGGCVACHGVMKGEPRPPNLDTWKTPIVNVGTDSRAWQLLFLRSVKTGGMEGASVPGAAPPLHATDKAIALTTVAALGAVGDLKLEAAKQERAKQAQAKPLQGGAPPPQQPPAAGQKPPAPPPPKPNAYEARVLHGVWAAAPYLHNGSVPTLADLLEPVAQRPKAFMIGPAYDTVRVGLAVRQTKVDFTLRTGCADRNSGDSNCGHAYGTTLSAADKKALLEFLKTL